MAQKAKIELYQDGSVVISNLRNNLGVPVFGPNDTITATLVSQYYDGSAMNDSKVDGKIYLKLKALPPGADDSMQQYVGKYFLVNLPNYGETFLEKDAIVRDSTTPAGNSVLRELSSTEILLLKMKYYKGVKVSGYYKNGDRPGSIEYILSTTSVADDGGSVIEVGGVKLEHKFNGDVNVKYFGCYGDGISDETVNIINASKLGLSLYFPRGTYNHTFLEISNENNTQGICLYGDGIGLSILRFVGDSGQSISFTRSTSFISNYSVRDITFDGNKKASEVNFYRHTDLDIYKCNFINHIGKTCVVDRSYQVNIKATKFIGSNDITPECLLYVATNAVTVDSECYFNAKRKCGAILVDANTITTDAKSYNVKIHGNVFESCKHVVRTVKGIITDTLSVMYNYIELIETTSVPFYLDEGWHHNFSFTNNYINSSTQASAILYKINRRSWGTIGNNKLHRPVLIYTEDGVLPSNALNARGIPSVNIAHQITLYNTDGLPNEGWVPNIIVDDAFYFQDLNVNRFSDSIDVRMPNFKGRLYKRSNSDEDVILLNISLPNSGGTTYARVVEITYKALWRQGNKSITGVNSNFLERHQGNIVASATTLITGVFDNNMNSTSANKMSDVRYEADNTINSVKLIGKGQLDTSLNEWIVDFEFNLFN